jgi:hypothetical protein
MPPKADHCRSSDHVEPILPDALYTAESLMRATGLGSWALRQLQRAGLKTRVRANRRWIVGRDFIEHITKDGDGRIGQ